MGLMYCLATGIEPLVWSMARSAVFKGVRFQVAIICHSSAAYRPALPLHIRRLLVETLNRAGNIQGFVPLGFDLFARFLAYLEEA